MEINITREVIITIDPKMSMCREGMGKDIK